MKIFQPNIATTSIGIEKEGSLVGSRSNIDFSEGANASISAVDNPSSNRVDVTISSAATNYAAAVIATGPSSYWKLDETGGTTAADVNSLVNGTYSGISSYTTASLVSNTTGTSVSIGATGGISLGSASYAFSGTQTFSWAAWVNLTSIDTTNLREQCIVHRVGTDGAGAQGYALWAYPQSSTSYAFEFKRYVNNIGVSAQGATLADLGTRHFVVGTYDGTASRFYMDGALVATSAADSRSIPVISRTLMLGNTGTTGGDNHGLRGLLDEVVVWTSAKNATTIASLYSAGL